MSILAHGRQKRVAQGDGPIEQVSPTIGKRVHPLTVLEYSVREAEKKRDFRSQHGAVKVLMAGGKPGPDAGGGR
jgi:hypothetical protein